MQGQHDANAHDMLAWVALLFGKIHSILQPTPQFLIVAEYCDHLDHGLVSHRSPKRLRGATISRSVAHFPWASP
jgi:hypothetical protein